MLQNASAPTLREVPTDTIPAKRAEQLALYRTLWLVRRAEEKIREEYFTNDMKTPVHLSVGGEAISVGVCHAMPPGTRAFGTYRNHALYLALTGETDRFFGELYGKATGAAKGKAGSMHLASPAQGLMATSAVVGTTIPLAVGAALAHQYRGEPNVAAAFFGDGAVEEGAFWESLNVACLRRLRVLFVCEDNGLAIHTPADQRQGFRSIPEALQGFRCHLLSGNGSDLRSVIAATRTVLERMAQDPRPGFLHLTYFRFLEHVGPQEDFHAGYRAKPSAEELARLDPVWRFEQELLADGVAKRDLEAVRASVDEQIVRSVEAARQAPFALPSELHTDVWAETDTFGMRNSERGMNTSIPEDAQPARITRTTFREALARALADEMDADPSVLVFGLDVPDHKRIFGSTAGLVERFGSRRCFGTPLSEDGMTGAALGAALCGLRPVHVHIRADFILLAMNQIGNMLCALRYMSGGQLRIPLVIRAVIGRGWGQSAQHSKSLHGLFAHFPGLKVVLPTTPQDAYSLLRASIRDENPVIFLEHRWLYDVEGDVDTARRLPLGRAAVRRTGKDLTVIATSWMTVEAMKAAEVLAARGVELEIVDVRSVVPLDEATLVASVAKTRRCLVADYDWSFCGFSAEAAALISHRCFGALERPVERLGFAQVPCPTTRPLENLFYPNAVTIIRTAEQMLGLPSTDLRGESFYSHEQRFTGPF